jgi:hypothetical protein
MSEGTVCLRRLGGDRSGAVRYGRFLHNKRVSREEMVATAAAHTGRAARGRHVLAIQDTTELNFSDHEGSKRGFGVVGNGRDIGLFLHPVIVVDAGDGSPRQVGHAGGVLGLVDALILNRPKAAPKASRKPLRDRARPIARRESARWIDGLRSADRELGAAKMVTVIADAECDIYEGFAEPRSPQTHLIVRAAHDRALSEGGRLFETMATGPQIVGWPIEIPAKAGQAARKAMTRVSWRKIEVMRPTRVYGAQDSLPAKLALSAVRVEEVDPPEGLKPILWLLLTTHEVTGRADAFQIAQWYRARWTIEQVFRTLKTGGMNIEESQVETPEAMAKLATAALIAALRVTQLVHARTGATGQHLNHAMDEAAEPLVEALVRKLEGKTEKQKCPHPKTTLARLAWVIGRLGGWDGYDGHGYKPAGPKTMAHGLTKFDAIRFGWETRQDV